MNQTVNTYTAMHIAGSPEYVVVATNEAGCHAGDARESDTLAAHNATLAKLIGQETLAAIESATETCTGGFITRFPASLLIVPRN